MNFRLDLLDAVGLRHEPREDATLIFRPSDHTAEELVEAFQFRGFDAASVKNRPEII